MVFDCVRLSPDGGRTCQALPAAHMVRDSEEVEGGHQWPRLRGQSAVRSAEYGARPRGLGARCHDLQRGLLGAGRRDPRLGRLLRPERVPRRRPRVAATIISFVLNIPVLIMMALLASSMPRTGGDYVWVSRILSPPLAVISNFGAALSAMIGATFWARYFPVFALGPVLVTLGVLFENQALVDAGNNFQKDGPLDLPGRLRDDRPDDRDPHRRHPGDLPLAERLLDHRLGRDVPGLPRPAVRQHGRLPVQLQHAEPEVRRHGRGRRHRGGRRAGRRAGPGQHRRHPADHLRDHGLHDVELVVGLPERRAQERLQPLAARWGSCSAPWPGT